MKDASCSGIAETSNLQLDQMIDQARYKHHQHRNKFKEAIDYLDQIFEDLKKEGDQVSNTQQSCGLPAAPMHKGASNGDSDLVNVTVPSLKLQRNGTTKRAMVNGVGLEEMDSRPVYLANTNRHSLYTTKPRIIKKHSRQEKAASFEQTSEDVSTSETVVLPSHDRKLKGERLDFTRRWLAGDIKSWVAVQPKPDLILGGVEEEPDIDERSLGSCSAEVAAINSVVRKKKKARDMPDLIQNVASTAKYIRHADANQLDPSVGKCSGGHSLQQTDPIRPRPVKPQTMFAFPSGSTGNLNSSGNFSQSFCDSNVWGSNCDINGNQNQQKSIPSQQRHRDFGTITWRSTSQDPRHNVLSSVRSEEIHHSARKTGAFTPLQPPNIVAMRGSVTSLPDSSGVRPQPLHSADPIVAIDALVAELELNTDQTLVVHKRRSFPTGNEFFVRHGGKDEKAVSTQNVEQSSVQQSVRTKLEGAKYHPQKLKASFNEMASMLESVISDVTAPNELPKGRKCAQKARKNSLIFSPFETINQEKLNPSKVEAMQSIFENKQRKNLI
uniref:Uncharacterized protein n=1 Tax=Setaria digitata TaxID=48799 RepID=A0A915PQV9_9BILA